jgi:hypothetical protein
MATPPDNNSKANEVSFVRNLGLFDATMIGIGAMIVKRFEGEMKSLITKIMG